MLAKRDANDPIFGGLIPDDASLDYIQHWENPGYWCLVRTAPGDWLGGLPLEDRLKLQYGNVIHLMQRARRVGESTDIGIQLFFVRKVLVAS